MTALLRAATYTAGMCVRHPALLATLSVQAELLDRYAELPGERGGG